MNQKIEEGATKGVICLFCGQSTSLPAPIDWRRSERAAELGRRASIVRCHFCGKEALYLPEEIVDLQAA
jgi:hypothetical protein